MTFSYQEIFDLAQRGIIAGPDETTEDFALRVSQLQEGPLIESSVYGVRVDWVPLFYSNKKLPFWQGGATWIENGRAEIQLRAPFAKKKRAFGYAREEILQHEAVHAIRSAFEEPVYEEIFAYRTSQKKWRRYLGPLFRSNRDAIIFMAALLLFPLGGLLILGLQSLRLWLDVNKYRKVVAVLEKITVKPEQFVLFLTDKEIRYFSKLLPSEIEAYAAGKTCCRWNQLRTLLI